MQQIKDKDLGHDIHAHYFPGNMPNWAEKFTGAKKYFWIDQTADTSCGGCAWMMKGDERFRSLTDSRLWEPEAYIEVQKQKGIDVMALSPTPQNFYYDMDPVHTNEIARFQNDQIAKLQQDYPGIFYGLGTVPLQDPDMACVELLRCKRDLKLPGVEIATSCNGEALADPKYFQVFELAAKIGAAIFVHPWYMPKISGMPPAASSGEAGEGWIDWLVGMPCETTVAMFRLCRAELMEKLPDLRIGFAHGGGSFPWLIERIKHGALVRPEYLGLEPDAIQKFASSVYYDSHVCGISELRYLIDKFGANKIMAGSDFPYPLGVEELAGHIKELNDPNLVRQILTTTPREFLGLDANRD